MPGPAVEPKVPDVPPAEPKPGETPPPPAEPSPLEKQLSDLQSKMDGLATWHNNQNQDVAALRRQLDEMRLENQTRLMNQPAQPDPLSMLATAYQKAKDDGDTIKALEIKEQYDAQKDARMASFMITNSVNAFADSLAENPSIPPEVRKEFLEAVYVDGNPKNAIKNEKLALLAQGGSLQRELADAKKRAMGMKVLSGDYDKEVITRYVTQEEAKKKALENQTPIAGNTGGGQPPAPPPLDAKAILTEELTKQAQVLRGEIPPPQG